jgi:hypothetical protein
MQSPKRIHQRPPAPSRRPTLLSSKRSDDMPLQRDACRIQTKARTQTLEKAALMHLSTAGQ